MRRGSLWSGLSFWRFPAVLEIPLRVVIYITQKSVDYRNMFSFQLAYIFALLICENLPSLCHRINSERLGAELPPVFAASLPTRQ